MIYFLEGNVTEITPASVVIDCSGVGYFVSISLNTFAQIQDKKNVKLLIHHIFRDDGQFLYGFISEDERSIFKLLITVSGVGANTARMILSAMPPSEIVETISTENSSQLQRIKGIGQKTAERIIVDLKGKIEKNVTFSENFSFQHNTIKQEALSALVQLGFNRQAAEKAVEKAMNACDKNSIEDVIRTALKYL